VEDRRGSEWRTAMQNASRWFGLSGNPNVGPMPLSAVLVVLGAALLAVGGRGAIGYLGGGLWIVGAVIAVRGWVRLMHLRANKPN
jgi:hypothetical protein